MSQLAERERNERRLWARGGGAHDRLVRIARRLLPVMVGALAAVMMFIPLLKTTEISFMLDKNKVDIVRERIRVSDAVYRGADDRGRPFLLAAGSAVQKSAAEPLVRLRDMRARIALADGPAELVADAARYDIDRQTVSIDGPIRVAANDGYRLTTRDVDVDMRTQSLASRGRVDGSMPLGRFSANRLRAGLRTRVVTLEGAARLHINQGALR